MTWRSAERPDYKITTKVGVKLAKFYFDSIWFSGFRAVLRYCLGQAIISYSSKLGHTKEQKRIVNRTFTRHTVGKR